MTIIVSLLLLMLAGGAQTVAPPSPQANLEQRIQLPARSDPNFRDAIDAIRKRIEAMPEYTVAQKEDKLALRKYLETRLMDVEFERIAAMEEAEYRTSLSIIKKDLDRLPENTTARKRDKRDLHVDFERRRVDMDLWRLTNGKKAETPAAAKAE